MLTKTQPQLTPRDWDAHPSYVYPGYKSTVKRGPQKPLIPLKASLGELQQPVYGHESIGEFDHDLTRNARRNGEPLGERMILTGQVLDERRRPVANTLVELWQANASGRYVHKVDQHDAPLDPNFLGAGRCLTDSEVATASSRSSPAPTPGATIRTPGVRSTSTCRCSARASRAAWSRRCTSRATRCCSTTRWSPARPSATATG